MEQIILDEINKVLSQEHLALLTDKSVRTNGGEYESPCPRCKRLHGDGGKNRFRVNPNRPVWGKGEAKEPCFACRQCMREDGSGKPWTGDLVGFVQWAYSLEYAQALSYLGLNNNGEGKGAAHVIRPQESVTGAPNEQWQARALEFILQAEEMLWSAQGAKELKYLHKRKLTDETIKKAHLGAVEVTHFEDAGLWGVSGKAVKVFKGVAIPEYHIVVREGVKYREIWSIAIRRDPDELIDEQAEDPDMKKPDRYRYIAGSQKGLYGFDTIKRGLPLVIVEGQIDQLTVEQEARGAFSAVAIQGTSGARSNMWIAPIATSNLVLFGLDPDKAGDKAYEYWENVIEQDRRFLWRPQSGDYNDMLRKGSDVYTFLCKGRDKFLSLKNFATGVTGVSLKQNLVDVPLQVLDALSFVSEPNTVNELEVTLPCDMCGHEFDPLDISAYPLSDTEALFLCIACYEKKTRDVRPLCSACGSDIVAYQGGAYDDEKPRHWCTTHFAGADLMEWGALYRWRPFTYPSEEGMVKAGEWKKVKSGKMAGGKENYVNFTRDNSPEVVWVAMWWCRLLVKGEDHLYWKHRTPEIEQVSNSCSRFKGGCEHLWNEKIRLSYEKKKDKQGNEYYGAPYLYAEEVGKEQEIAGYSLHWCAKCYQCGLIMEFGDLLDFPAFHNGTVHLSEGPEAWIDVVSSLNAYDTVVTFDELRRAFPHVWDKIMDALPA